MTAIAGLAHEGRVWIGGDSAAVGGLDLTVRTDPKVFRNGPAIIGFSTSYRMGQLLNFSLEIPKFKGDADLAYMCGPFIKAVQKCFRDGKLKDGGLFLVGITGHLYYVDVDFQVGESASGYDAVGCGAPFILGAMHSNGHMKPKERVLDALAAAEANSGGVRSPFLVKSLK